MSSIEDYTARSAHPNEEKKCAPSKRYKDGSCFSDMSLKKIVESYNKRNNSKRIDINLPRAKLIDELENRLADKCSEQTCWLRLDFVKAIEDEDIEENTFRPKGPNKKYEWLSTTHINDVLEQYQKVHNDFVFLGAVPNDFEDLPVLGISNLRFEELEKNGKHKIGMVINLDNHNQGGSHWVALYADLKQNQIYFFDSIGKPPTKRVKKFINRIAKYLYKKKFNSDISIKDTLREFKNNNKNTKINKMIGSGFDCRYNHIQHQKANSECGVYSINFIIRLAGGESFDNVINNVTRDEEMNGKRKEYFRNVN